MIHDMELMIDRRILVALASAMALSGIIAPWFQRMSRARSPMQARMAWSRTGASNLACVDTALRSARTARPKSDGEILDRSGKAGDRCAADDPGRCVKALTIRVGSGHVTGGRTDLRRASLDLAAQLRDDIVGQVIACAGDAYGNADFAPGIADRRRDRPNGIAQLAVVQHELSGPAGPDRIQPVADLVRSSIPVARLLV